MLIRQNGNVAKQLCVPQRSCRNTWSQKDKGSFSSLGSQTFCMSHLFTLVLSMSLFCTWGTVWVLQVLGSCDRCASWTCNYLLNYIEVDFITPNTSLFLAGPAIAISVQNDPSLASKMSHVLQNICFLFWGQSHRTSRKLFWISFSSDSCLHTSQGWHSKNIHSQESRVLWNIKALHTRMC